MGIKEAPQTPNWEDAPVWATWWAVDSDGTAYWYENQPTWDDWTGIWSPPECHGHMCGDSVLDRSGVFDARNAENSLVGRES